MISVPQETIDAVNGNGRQIVPSMAIVKTGLPPKAVTSEQIKTVTALKGACGSQPLSGSMFIPSAEVELYEGIAEVTPEYEGGELLIRCKVNNTGVFVLSKLIISKVSVSNGITKISCVGSLSTLGSTQAAVTHTEIADILDEISAGTGMTIRLQGATASGSLESIPEGTWRSVLQEVAIALGGFVTEDNTGKWTIAKFGSGSIVAISADRSQRAPEYDHTYSLDGRQVESGIAEMTMGNPLIDPWDTLLITDIGGNTHWLPCLKITHTFNGGLETSIEATVETAIQEGAKIEGPVNSVVQHFWFDGAGAHVTSVSKQDYLDDPAGAGGNTLITSSGMNVRNGTDVLAEFTSDGIQMKNGTGLSVLDIDSESNLTSIFITEGPFPDSLGGQQCVLANMPMTDTSITMYVVIDAVREIFNCTAGTAYTASGTITTADTDYTIRYDGEKTIALELTNASVTCFFQYIYYNTYSYQPILTYGTSKGLRGGFSATLGEGLEAPSNNQVAVGMYNEAIGGDLFEVGVGTDDYSRKTMFAVSGSGMYGGDVYESAMSTAGKNAGFMAHRTDTGRKVFLCVSTDGQSVGVWDTNKSNWIIRHDGSGALYTNLGAVADQVIQQGTSGIWTYRKWSSGIAECWGSTATFSGAFTTQWGNAYYTSEKKYNFPSGLFLSGTYPAVTCQVWDNGGLGWATVETLNNTQVGFYLSNPASTTRTTQLYIQAQGRWK